MGQQVSFTFIANGDAMNFDIGFKPDYIEAYSALGGTELGFKWFRVLADAAAAGQYGIAISNTGAVSICSNADNGFIEYNGNEVPLVRIVAPDGDGFSQVKVYGDWDATVDYSSVGTIRSTSAVGTIVRPPIHNGKVFELTTKTGTAASEPTTWDVAPGESVTDGGSNVWICREEDIVRGAGLGFTIGATISSDSEIWVVKAERHDRMGDMGDTAEADPATF